MLRHRIAVLALALLASSLVAEAGSRPVTCYFLAEEGDSAEGNALARRFMGLEPALLAGYAPVRFERVKGGYAFSAEGQFGFSAGESRELERYGRVVLSSAQVELRAPAPPRAWKTRKVSLRVVELAARRGAVQPAQAAIEAAARELGLERGRAWIISMELLGTGLLRATVGFAR